MVLISVRCSIILLVLTCLEVISGGRRGHRINNFHLKVALHSPLVGAGTSDICTTPGCVKAAADILHKVNLSVDPCENFYQFACGSFISTSYLPDEKNEVKILSVMGDRLNERLRDLFAAPPAEGELEVFKKVKVLYHNCMDTDKIEEIGLTVAKERIAEFGGWPVVLGLLWDLADNDWKKIIYKLRKYGYQTGHLLDVGIQIDIKNNTRQLLAIGPPQFGLARNFLILGRNDTIVKAYHNFMADVAVEFGATKEFAQADFESVLEMEILLANNTLASSDKRDINEMYKLYTVGEIQELYPSIPWIEFINGIIGTGLEIDASEIALLDEPKYFVALEESFKKYTPRTFINYLIWRFIQSTMFTLSRNLEELSLSFQKAVKGIKALQPRTIKCINNVNFLLPNVASAMYVRKHFTENERSKVKTLIEYLKKAFHKILEDNDWMNEDTKKKGMEKLAAMGDHIGHPREHLDDETLTKAYGEIDIQPGEFHKSVANVDLFEMNMAFKKFRDPVNNSEWMSHGNVAQINAFYRSGENAMMLPAGILTSPVFDIERPSYLNFGSLGSIIGHELTHGFDDMGRQYGEHGNLQDWWDDETENTFNNRTDCIKKQYSSCIVSEIGEPINGNSTVGENIADNAGYKQGYYAYELWRKENPPEPKLPGLNYTANQMFWIAGAQIWCAKVTNEALRYALLTDVHSPNEFRVTVPFSNLYEFSRDYKCPSGSAMNPEKKCHVW